MGVNTAIQAGAQGIGFAIAIDSVKTILPQLEKKGYIKSGYIGVYIADINPFLAKSLNLPRNIKGVLIRKIEAGGPAHLAGLQPQDVIVQVNRRKVKKTGDLLAAVAASSIGKKIPVRIVRFNKEKTFEVMVAERPSSQTLSPKKSLPTTQKGVHIAEYGFYLGNLNRKVAKDWNLNANYLGRPVVLQVERGSRASRANLGPGDIILKVNQKPVYRSSDVVKALKKEKRPTHTMSILRQRAFMLIIL